MARRPPPLILAYHGVAAVPAHRDPHGLFVSARVLRRQLALLRRWGYEAVTFGELAGRVRAGAAAARGSLALTFDDGLADNLETLAPLLRDEGARATVFVPTGWMGRPHPDAPHARVCTREEVRELHRAGVEIGSHTVSHPRLPALAPAEQRAEIAGAMGELSDLLRAPVDLLAYPYGEADATTRSAAAAAGVRAACRVAGEGSWADPLDLPRQDTNTKTAIGLWLKRDDRYEPLMRRAGIVAHAAASRVLERVGTRALSR